MEDDLLIDQAIRDFLLFPLRHLRQYGGGRRAQKKLRTSLSRALNNMESEPLEHRPAAAAAAAAAAEEVSAEDRRAQRVMKYYRQGRFRKGTRMAMRRQMATMECERVRAIVERNFIAAPVEDFPELPENAMTYAVGDPKEIRETLRKMDSEAAGGPTQWTVPLLRTLVEDDTCLLCVA